MLQIAETHGRLKLGHLRIDPHPMKFIQTPMAETTHPFKLRRKHRIWRKYETTLDGMEQLRRVHADHRDIPELQNTPVVESHPECVRRIEDQGQSPPLGDPFQCTHVTRVTKYMSR